MHLLDPDSDGGLLGAFIELKLVESESARSCETGETRLWLWW
jgi:hypothetical protein